MKIIRRLCALLVLVSTSFANHAAIFKCRQPNDSYAFQDSPCQSGTVDEARNNQGSTKEDSRSTNASTRDATATSQARKIHDVGASRSESTSRFSDAVIRNPSDRYQQVSAAQSAMTIDSSSETSTEPPAQRKSMDFKRAWDAIWIPLLFYIGVAGLLGYWARARNRSFWRWFTFAMLFNPAFVFLIFLFRGQDPEHPPHLM